MNGTNAPVYATVRRCTGAEEEKGGGGQLVAKLAHPHRGDFYFPIRRASGQVYPFFSDCLLYTLCAVGLKG